jgi:uncharacterized membrane protein YdjX (TVP38/TMEM64 family)
MSTTSGSPTRADAPLPPVVKAGYRANWLLYLGLVVVLIAAMRYYHVHVLLKQALDWIGRLGPWGPVTFILIYALATVLFFPGSVLTFGAGVLFDVVAGTIYVSIGAELGATCAFLLGRYFARETIVHRLQDNETFATIDKAVAEDGWKIVGLTRLSPIFPFTLLNYAFGLTRVSLRDYALASWIGMMPGTVMYVYLGSLVHVGSGHHDRTPVEMALYGVGLIATLVVTLLVTRLARRALAKRISSANTTPVETPAASSPT